MKKLLLLCVISNLFVGCDININNNDVGRYTLHNYYSGKMLLDTKTGELRIVSAENDYESSYPVRHFWVNSSVYDIESYYNDYMDSTLLDSLKIPIIRTRQSHKLN